MSNQKDLHFFIPMGLCLAVIIGTILIWVGLSTNALEDWKFSRSPAYLKAMEIEKIEIAEFKGRTIEKIITEVESMDLQELNNLKTRVEDFKSGESSNFQMDISGILEIFK